MDIKVAYKFCPRCGAKFEKQSELLKCNSCGLNFYINPKACNGLVLRNRENEILLVERAIEPSKGLWDVPGGFVEIGETFEQSMLREAKEELGIELGPIKYLGSFVDEYIYQDIVYPTLAVMYESSIKPGFEFIPADDVASYRFFKLNALPRDRFAFAWMHKFFSELS